jgi:hypothetical protein
MQTERKQHIKKCGNCGKIVKWFHGSRPEKCPYCDCIKWYKPDDECKLFNLQDKYLETRDNKYLSQMYNILYPYTKRIILKMLHGHKSYDDDKLEDKIQGTVTYFISYYLRKDTYRVTDSFGFLLKKGAEQQLYSQKVKDVDSHELSYDKPMTDGETTFLSELKADNVPLEYEKTCIENDLTVFIDKMFMKMCEYNDLSTAILALRLFHLYTSGTKIDYNLFYSIFGTEFKNILETEKFAIYEFIQDMEKFNYSYYE